MLDQVSAALNTSPAAKLAKAVLASEFSEGNELAYIDGEFKYFTGKFWSTLSDDQIGGILLNHAPTSPATGGPRGRTLIREAIEMLKMFRAKGDCANRLDEPVIINVENGEIRFRPDGSYALSAHDPKSGQRHCLGVKFDPKATCPTFDRAIMQIFSASTYPAAMSKSWFDAMGYILQPTRPIPLVLVAWGSGGDGKSALAKTISRLLGSTLVAAMPVEDLVGRQFAMGDFEDKRLFLDDDVQTGAQLPDGLLKKLGEATATTVERKFKARKTIDVRAVPLLCCNMPPRVSDRSHAFRRRLAVFPFDRSFSPAEVDHGLFPRIWATEMPGVLNRLLHGLRRVIGRGWKFDMPAEVMQATDKWLAIATAGVSQSKGTTAPRSIVREPAAPVTAAGTHPSLPTHCGDRTNVKVIVPRDSGDYAVKVEVGGCVIEVQTAPSAVTAGAP